MTPDQVAREIRILRYSPNRSIGLATLANVAGLSHETLYEIAISGSCSDLAARKIGQALERLRSNPGQAAISKRRTPVTEPSPAPGRHRPGAGHRFSGDRGTG
jgi:hypothetical protein